MARLRILLARLRGLFGKVRSDERLDDEIALHLELETQKRIAAGLPPDEARRQARIAFGAVEAMKEEHRDSRGVRWIEQRAQDIRYAVRALLRRPAFCSVVVLTLALGIGATSAIFAVVSTVLLKPLPYQDASRLAMIWSRWSNFNKTWISQDEYLDYRRQTALFQDVGAWSDNGEVTITAPGADPESATAEQVTANLFDVLGVHPFLGRSFTITEDLPNGPPAVVLGYQLWRRRWGGDPAIVGKTITMDGAPVRVVGVLPATFRFPLEFQRLVTAQIVEPIQFDPGTPSRGSHCCYGVARLKPGVTAATVTRELGALATRWKAQYPNQYPEQMHFTAFAVPMLAEVHGSAQLALSVVAAAVVFLLLLTCTNVANLMLTRADSQQREVAVRSALGAGTGRIIRSALTESLILGVTGGVLGLGLACAGMRLLVARAPTAVPRIADLAVNWRLVAFTLLLSVGTGVLFGLVPVLRSMRFDLAGALRDGRGQSAGAARRRGRTLLVVAEMALAVLLLIGAGLTVRSFINLLRIDPGFDARNVMTMRLALPAEKYASVDGVNNFFRILGDKVRQLPGVQSAGFIRLLPLATEMGDAGLVIEGKPVAANLPGREADWQAASPGYFDAMRIRLVSGRFFDSRDGLGGPPAIIINQELAREYFPGENPIGKGIKVGNDTAWRTVVGVVGDVRHNGLSSPPKRGFYLPQDQWMPAFGAPRRAATLVIRTRDDLRAVLAPIQSLVHQMDRDLPLTQVVTMSDVLGSATEEQRFTMMIMALFAVLAMVLAAVGIYGVISDSVSKRTREIGIRLALGARVKSVHRLVLLEGMLPAAIGVGIGVGLAAGLTRFLSSLLYGVAPIDGVIFAVIPVALLVVAALAVLIPARRAARVDPMRALREE
ncbi:MAG: ADOP family duplicated permease [Gemmatimonadales bacterium]